MPLSDHEISQAAVTAPVDCGSTVCAAVVDQAPGAPSAGLIILLIVHQWVMDPVGSN